MGEKQEWGGSVFLELPRGAPCPGSRAAFSDRLWFWSVMKPVRSGRLRRTQWTRTGAGRATRSRYSAVAPVERILGPRPDRPLRHLLSVTLLWPGESWAGRSTEGARA